MWRESAWLLTLILTGGGQPNFLNRTLYHGDNLDFLRGMNSETVHLIATDPPFNKNRDFHATPDSLARGARFKDRWRWDEDVHEEWTDSIIDDYPAVWEVITAARAAYGDDMGAFLCWLGVRLMEMRRVLRADGSIYLHIDHTAHAYVKCMMDAIFGCQNFRNEIVWCYTGPSNSKRWFQRKHDTILFYVKSRHAKFNADSVRVPYKSIGIQADNPKYGIFRSGANRERVQELLRIGKVPTDWWADDFLTNVSAWRKERTGFPTQKPLALYRRIIRASSIEDDIVLDPFCGCATTCVAAEQLERRWVGMDIWDGAHQTVLDRLQDEWLFTADAAEQVMFPHEVHYTTEPPQRTDAEDMAARKLKLPDHNQRPAEPWQTLTRRQMVRVLAEAQASSDGVICAGCGRVLEVEFMQLDHITPKSGRGENHILNRILLCGPCNRRKKDTFTLPGLVKENKKKAVGWMKDESRAKLAQAAARDKAEWTRDYFTSPECQELING